MIEKQDNSLNFIFFSVLECDKISYMQNATKQRIVIRFDTSRVGFDSRLSMNKDLKELV